MKAHNISKSILALSLAVIAVSSCQEKIGGFTKGEAVKFTIGTDASDTKAAYSGDKNTDGTIERIDWETGDLIRIYCAQASGIKSADYAVTSVNPPSLGSEKSTAFIESAGGAGLLWGEGEHIFYAVYPSPEEESGITTSISPYTDGGTKGSVSKSIEGATVTAKLPAKQAIAQLTATTPDYVASPNLENMLMTAKSGPYTVETFPKQDKVFLSFIPLTTAVQFTITNQTGADIKVQSVSLISGNGKTTAPAINGAFSVNLDSMSKPADIDLGASKITYSREYPACTRDASLEATTSMGLRTSTISFDSPVPLTYNATASAAGKLTFTFFLTPTCNFDDITFKIVMTDSEGNNTRWMSTKLGYTDGTGVLFPRFKKTTVNGVFIPGGAQWTVKYGPTVYPWNQSSSDIDPMPEVNEGSALVTSWDTGIEEELELNPKPAPEYILGDFSVDTDGKRVRFSKGNLQFKAGDGTNKNPEWRFAEHQYDYIGNAPGNTTADETTRSTQADWIDLFGWGATGRTDINEYLAQPYSINDSDSYYKTIAIPSADETLTRANGGDWGVCMGDGWRTLSSVEWKYLLETRTVNGGKGEGKSYSTGITYGGNNGLVLYPDDYTGTALSGTVESLPEGVVFLPVADFRCGSSYKPFTMGCYWSCTASSDGFAYYILFSTTSVSSTVTVGRSVGQSVRLVIDVETPAPVPPAPIEYVDLGLSLNWASCNLGASSPEEFGEYFAWGATEGYKPTGTTFSHNFNWANAPFNGGSTSYDETYFNSVIGTVCPNGDGILAPEYDAAHVQLGGTWHIPTQSDFGELISNTSCSYVSDYKSTDVEGFLLTSTVPGYTDKSVFFPLAGFADGMSLTIIEGSNSYWTAEYNYMDLKYEACAVSDVGNLFSPCFPFRCNGFPIRPVCSKE